MVCPVLALLVLKKSPTGSTKEICAHCGQRTITRMQNSLTGNIRSRDWHAGRLTIDHVETVHPLYLTQHLSGLSENIHQYVSACVCKIYAVRLSPPCTRDSWGQKIPKSACFRVESDRINLILIRSTQHSEPS